MADIAKRANEEPQSAEAPQPKRRKTSKAKRKDNEAKEDEGKAGAPNLLYFEEQKEAALLFQNIESRRQNGKQGDKSLPQLQLLSEWRLFQEITRQQKDPVGGTGLSALRGDTEGDSDTVKHLLGFEPALLDLLQLAATSHLRDILLGASKIARQRREGSQKPDGFAVVEDVRIGLGEIRKRDEEAAKTLKEKQDKLLLKTAANRRADDETREKAQKLKEQMAGQQQAVAANKALAATLGGDAKWTKWGSAGNTSVVAKPAIKVEENVGSPAETADKTQTQKADASSAPHGADARKVTKVADLSKDTSLEITIDDIVAFIETKPEYANSHVLYRLLNLKSMT
jgi:hypothetical protein